MLLIARAQGKSEYYSGLCSKLPENVDIRRITITQIPINIINAHPYFMNYALFESKKTYYKTKSLDYHSRFEKTCPQRFLINADRTADLMETNVTATMEDQHPWNLTIYLHMNYQDLVLFLGCEPGDNNCRRTETLWLLIWEENDAEKDDVHMTKLKNVLLQMIRDSWVRIDDVIAYIELFKGSSEHALVELNVWYLVPLFLIFLVISVLVCFNDLLRSF